jgi:quercetin dioxygenase-like cupin family protein
MTCAFYTRFSTKKQSVSLLSLTPLGEMDMSKNGKAELKSKASNLAGLIDYQEGSVVSRTIIDRKTDTITLFAFDENQGLSEHIVPLDALVYVLEGEVEITISGKLIKLKQGEITIMPANKPHALKAKTKFKMLLTMVKS